jgi:hypothetical protein
MLLSGGLISARGGNGGTASGAVNGGDGGYIGLLSDFGDVFIGTQLVADGGAGRAQGGLGGYIEAYTDEDSAADAGDIVVEAALYARGGSGIGGGNGNTGGTIDLYASAAGTSGTIDINATLSCTGGAGAVGGNGGMARARTTGSFIRVAAVVTVNAGATNGDGGTITVGLGADVPGTLVIAFSARLYADGTGATGAAGLIGLDAVGSAPNPNLVLETGSVLSTRDGDGTDRAATNQTLD